MLKMKLGNRGISLLEVTVGLSVGAMATYALVGSINSLTKLSNRQIAKNDLSAMATQLSNTLSNDDNCEANFKDKELRRDPSSGEYNDVPLSQLVTAGNTRVIMSVNGNLSSIIKVASLTLREIEENSADTMIGQLHVGAKIGKSSAYIFKKVPLMFDVRRGSNNNVRLVTSCRSSGGTIIREVASVPDPATPPATPPTLTITSVRAVYQPGSASSITIPVPAGVNKLIASGKTNFTAGYGFTSEDTSFTEVYVDLVAQKTSGSNMHTGGNGHQETMAYVWNNADFGRQVRPQGDSRTGGYAAAVDDRRPIITHNAAAATLTIGNLIRGPVQTIWMVKFLN